MMFCSGPAAPEFHDLLAPYAPRIRVITGPVGTAALLKNVTEVLSKGGQALLWEALVALVKSGQPLWDYVPPVAVEGGGESPGYAADWLIPHAAIHARRKSEELEEVAATLRSLGVDPLVTEAAAQRLRRVEQYGLRDYFRGKVPAEGYRAVIAALKELGVDLR